MIFVEQVYKSLRLSCQRILIAYTLTSVKYCINCKLYNALPATVSSAKARIFLKVGLQEFFSDLEWGGRQKNIKML